MSSTPVSAQPRLLRDEEAADFLGIKRRTLSDWRLRRCGPPYVRISNRCVRYAQNDLEFWIKGRVVPSAATE
jgi:predicted DNA-binding transcriptional regulator AlpA